MHLEGPSMMVLLAVLFIDVNKKAQLTLTNPRNAKACRKLLQFDVKTSCRQLNNLFEVMQQPSAPSDYIDIDAFCSKITCFPPPYTCLTPHSRG